MTRIFKFNEFMNEAWEDIDFSAKKNAAGVAIIWNKQILLVHPTGSSWQKSALGIPKGGIESGEDILEAAVRELREETGIILQPTDLDPEPLVANYYNKNGSLAWQLIYFTKVIESLDQINLKSARIPKNQLQLTEIDWAGFVPIDQAYHKIHRSQLIILDRSRDI